MSNVPTIFVSLSAQHGNLGDHAIRQSCLDIMKSVNARFACYVAGMPMSYLDAYDLPGESEMISKKSSYFRMLFSEMVRGRAIVVLSPGPAQVKGARALIRSLLSVLMLLTTRLFRGKVFILGRGIRTQTWADTVLQRCLVRVANLFTVRDEDSSAQVGRAIDVYPDLAFGLPDAPRSDERGTVAISLRYDSGISNEYVRQIVDRVRADGLEPVFVTQVDLDREKHSLFAETHGARHLDWSKETHREQIERVLNLYAQSHSVVTDRLHASIFGIRAGAFPVVVRRGTVDKLVSTLGRLFELGIEDPERHVFQHDFMRQDEVLRRERLLDAVGEAQRDVRALSDRVKMLCD